MDFDRLSVFHHIVLRVFPAILLATVIIVIVKLKLLIIALDVEGCLVYFQSHFYTHWWDGIIFCF